MRIFNPRISSCVFAAMMLLVFSCGKDNDTNPEPTTPTTPTIPTTPIEPTSMSAKVDGELWTIGSFGASAIIYNDFITIFGMSSDNYEMNMTLYGNAEGTYSLNPEMGSHLYYGTVASSTYDSKLNNVNTNHGMVEITKLDMENLTMSGTFESEPFYFFNELSTGGIVISEGEFTNIEVLDYRDPDAESLSAEIDGRPLKALYTSAYISQSRLIVSGEDGAQTEKIQMSMPMDIAPGTYDIGNSSVPNLEGQYNPLFSNVMHSATSGTLTITTNDMVNKMIIGTFNFETPGLDGNGVFSINSGSFRASYD